MRNFLCINKTIAPVCIDPDRRSIHLVAQIRTPFFNAEQHRECYPSHDRHVYLRDACSPLVERNGESTNLLTQQRIERSVE
jgi:hypothetical protein